MTTPDFIFGVVAGCLATLLSVLFILAWYVSPYIKEAARRNRG